MIRLQLALHRLLRVALPSRLRRRRGADMDATFLHMLEHDRGSRLRLWMGEIGDVVGTGLRLRRQGVSERRRMPRIDVSWLDVKLGLRMLVKHPGLTAVAVFALAIGIPVGLAPWHLVNAIEAPLPVDEGARVQVLRYWNEATSRQDATRLDDFVEWRATLTGFEALGAARRGVYNVNADTELMPPVRGAEVTASTFDILRVPPLHGRTIIAADEVPGAPDVVVVGYDLWRTRLGADPDIVGRSLRIGRDTHTVVGVMPEGFLFPVRDGLWLPLREQLAAEPFRGLALTVFGRLSDGVSAADAQTELRAVSSRIAAEFPDSHARLRPEVVPFAVVFVGAPAGGMRSEMGFYVVQILVLMTLLVACTNVGMLIFARTATRSEELAVRTALGAGRARIVWQIFTESLVLACMAVGVGLFAADRILNFLQREVGGGLPYWVDLGVTGDAAARALALAVVSAAAAGVVPALRVTGKAVQRNIQGAAGRRTGIRFGGVSGALIVADVALAVAIVGLAAASLENLTTLDREDAVGIPVDQYLSVELGLLGIEPAADAGATDREQFASRVGATQQALVERLEAEPGIRGVAVGTRLPRMDHPSRRVELDDEALMDDPRGHQVQVASVDVSFFDGLDQPILLGRGFDSSDIGESRLTVIVNTTFVETVLDGRDPIGRRLRYKGVRGGESGPWLEIVGVVGRLGMNVIMPAQDAGLYHPMAPGEIHPVKLGIHVGDDPESFAPRLRQLVAEIDPLAVIVSPVALDEIVQDDLVALFLMTWGGTILVGVLVLLAASGIYAIMSFRLPSAPARSASELHSARGDLASLSRLRGAPSSNSVWEPCWGCPLRGGSCPSSSTTAAGYPAIRRLPWRCWRVWVSYS